MCVFVSHSEYLEYSTIFKAREISYQKLRTDRQQTNTQMIEIKDMSYTYKGQLSTDKDDRKLGHILGHMSIIPFSVWAGIKIKSSPNWKWNQINSSPNKKWEDKNIHKL